MGARVRVISIILSFTTPFVVSEGVHTYLLLGDGSGLSLHDSMTDRARTFIVQASIATIQAADRLTISLPTAGLLGRDRRGEVVPVIGSVPPVSHIAGTVVLADAPAGQVPDQFRNTATAIDKDLFRFTLRTVGKAITVTRLAFSLGLTQLTPQALTSFRLLEDTTLTARRGSSISTGMN